MLKKALLVFAYPSLIDKSVKCLSLSKPVPTNPIASNSVILSLAAHVTFKFPHLNLSNFDKKCPIIRPEQKEVNRYLTNHPLHEFWCEKFFESIFKNHAFRKDDTLYLIFELSDSQFVKVSQDKQKLVEFQVNYKKDWADTVLKTVSESEQITRKNTKIAYLNVSGSQLRTDPYIPIINVKALVVGQIYDNQNWIIFNILRGQVPTLQQFLQFDGVVIPGSTNSVLLDIPQIQKMSKNMFYAFQKSKKLKIFGICYGHQLIAQKNKGKVVRKLRTDKIEKIDFNLDLVKQLSESFGFLSQLAQGAKDTLLLEHHEDYVEKVSDDFYVLASSQTSQVQCLMHKTGRMLSFQSHPEYFQEYTEGFIGRLMFYQYNQILQEKQSNKNLPKNTIHHQSSIRIRKVISKFLNWKGIAN